MPEITTWPSMAGVTARFIGRPRRGRSAWEPRLAGRQLVGPDDDALALLPLEQDRPVGGLESVLVDRVVAEDRARLERQQRFPHLVGVQRAGLLDALGVDHAAPVAGRRVVAGLVLELLDVRLVELPGARIGQARLPLRRAVDVLRGLLEQLLELRDVAAHGNAEHLRRDVEL